VLSITRLSDSEWGVARAWFSSWVIRRGGREGLLILAFDFLLSRVVEDRAGMLIFRCGELFSSPYVRLCSISGLGYMIELRLGRGGGGGMGGVGEGVDRVLEDGSL